MGDMFSAAEGLSQKLELGNATNDRKRPSEDNIDMVSAPSLKKPKMAEQEEYV